MKSELENVQEALNKTAFVASLDQSGKLVTANQKLLYALGRSSQETIGLPMAELFSDHLAVSIKNEILAGILKGSPWKGQIRYATKAGRPLWIEASIQPHHSELNVLIGFTFIGFDITEQKAVEEALHNNKIFLRKLMASAPVAFFLADSTGQCELINHKWFQMTGLSLRQAAGSGWMKAIHPEDFEKVNAAWSRLIRDGVDFQMEFRYRTSLGREVSVLSSASILRDASTSEARVIRIEQDLTDQKQNEDIINAQKAQIIATAKLTSLGEMASSIAHEINNPLTAILGSAELLKTTLEAQSPDPARMNRLADTIMKTTLRIAKIIKSLRMISRDADNDIFEMKELGTIFNDTLEMCSATARAQQTQLKISAIDPQLKLYCKSTQIAQCLLSLVRNSLWAVQASQEKWIEIDVKELEDSVEISVTDSGFGISGASREKVFNPFYTTKPVGKGTGLGLSVAKGIIENHHGTLRLDETSGNTRFIISLPKRVEERGQRLTS